jgi:hypothetical protein
MLQLIAMFGRRNPAYCVPAFMVTRVPVKTQRVDCISGTSKLLDLFYRSFAAAVANRGNPGIQALDGMLHRSVTAESAAAALDFSIRGVAETPSTAKRCRPLTTSSLKF